jgi:hypothetical protein
MFCVHLNACEVKWLGPPSLALPAGAYTQRAALNKKVGDQKLETAVIRWAVVDAAISSRLVIIFIPGAGMRSKLGELALRVTHAHDACIERGSCQRH